MLHVMRTILVMFCLSSFSSYGFAVVTNCTIYVSPSGGGSGTTAGSPTTLADANMASVPGSVICLEGGTYNIASTFGVFHTGTAGNYITWIGYGDSPTNFVWTGGSGTNDGTGRFLIQASGLAYLKFISFNMDGQSHTNECLLLQSGHHFFVQNLFVKNCLGDGIGTTNSDYVTVDHSVIWHCGENPNGDIFKGSNAGSGISLNKMTLFDSYAGLHNIVSNNLISGDFDPSTVTACPCHTDGNGITLDLTDQATSGATLVVNNVVFGNGARGILVHSGSGGPNYWTNTLVINNTVYVNDLDLTLATELANYDEPASKNTHYINNISYAWSGWSGTVANYLQKNSPTGTTYDANLWFGGVEASGFTPGAGFIHGDPLFVNPPTYNSSAGGQYANSINPQTLGTGLQLQAGSPARGVGVDPSTISGIAAQAINDMRPYIYADINGIARPHSGQDLGAYQSAASTALAPAPPTGLTATVN